MDSSDHFGVQRCFELPAVTLAVVNIDDDLGTQVGWHYHENPHLTFILRGDVIEGTKKQVYHWKKFCVLTMRKNSRWKSCDVSWQS